MALKCAETWSSKTHPGSSAGSERCAFNHEPSPLYLMGGGTPAVLHSSTNGIDWTSRTVAMTSYVHGIAWGSADSIWVITGWSGAATGKIETSPDGITWTNRGYTTGGRTLNTKVAYGNGRFVMCSYNTKFLLYSDNGTTWSDTLTLGTVVRDWESIAYGGGSTWMAIDTLGNVYKSTDNGYTWGASIGTVNSPNSDLVWSAKESLWIACGGVKIETSPTGATWTTRHTGSLQVYKMDVSDRCHVAGGQTGELLVSEDAITWTNPTLGSANYRGVAAGAGKWVITSSTELYIGSPKLELLERGVVRGYNRGIFRGM